MWRKLIVAGTIAVAVFVGSALALASPGAPSSQPTRDSEQVDHWTEMEFEMGDLWREMVGHMQGALGDGYQDMVDEMRSLSSDMGRSDMGDSWGGMHG